MLVAAIALVLAPLAVFGLWRWAASGDVLAVTAGPVMLGGLAQEEALAALTTHEDQLASAEVPYLIDRQPFALDPMQVGFDIRVKDFKENGRLMLGKPLAGSNFSDTVLVRKLFDRLSLFLLSK